MQTSSKEPTEPVKPAKPAAGQVQKPIRGFSAKLADNNRPIYHLALTINGRPTSISLGIPKAPEDPSGKAAAECKDSAAELAVNINRYLQGRSQAQKLHQTFREAFARVLSAISTMRADYYLVPWVRRHAKLENLALSTVRMYVTVIDRLLTRLRDTGRSGCMLAAVTEDDIKDLMASFAVEKDAASSFNKRLTCVRAAFNSAIREHHIAFNPAHAVKYQALDESEKEPFTLAEIERLFHVMNIFGELGTKEWKLATLLALNLGHRSDDVFSMTWGQINLETKQIELAPGKNRRQQRKITLPIIDELYRILTELVPGKPDDPLFRTMDMRESASRSESFVILMERAQIPCELEAPDNGRGRRRKRKKTFHCLRHTLNFWMELALVSKEHRMGVLGQTTESAQERYRHEQAEVLRAELEKLPHLKSLCAMFISANARQT